MIISITNTLSYVWDGASSLSDFGHLLEMAFGSGIAYAVLIRTGRLQGSYIEDYCLKRHQEAMDAYTALTAEDKALTDKIEIRANKVRCDNHVAECRKLMSMYAKRFAIASVIVSLLCILILTIAGIWHPIVPNLIILIGIIIAFAPVPVGLAWTYYLVQQAETQIKDEYKNFYVVVDVVRDKLKEETKRAMREIDNRRNAKSPNLLQRLFLGH